jgi:hypothetical protein
MKRRTFLQLLLGAPTALLVSAKQPATGYTDSDRRSAAALAPLHDGKKQTGGVQYTP